MQVGPGADSIHKLLAAEKEAQRVVKAARDEKAAKIKQAQQEAAREVAAYKAQREDAYKQMMERGKGDAASRLTQLQGDTDGAIRAMTAAVNSKKSAVCDQITAWVTRAY